MRGSGESVIWALAFEFVPAVIFGSAAAFASATALALPRFGVVPISTGAIAFALSWLMLRRLGSAAKTLPLADFDQSELEREFEALAEEMQLAEAGDEAAARTFDEDELILESELPAPLEEELILEDQLISPAIEEEDSRVVRLFDPRTATAGEMQERIQTHLRNSPRPPLSDATQELHEALSALRQSLR
jgi:hypothetical protein